MTRKERLEAVIAGVISEELITDCQRELEKLNAKETERKTKLTPNQEANKVVEAAIIDALIDGEPHTIEEIGQLFNNTYTRQKLTAICTNLVREGKINSEKIKVKGKGERVAYRLG